jgi:RecA-family ATPase
MSATTVHPSLLRVTPIHVGTAAFTKLAPTDFIIGPLQAGELGIVSGADGLGKSWLALEMAATVATGISVGQVFEAPNATGRVLLVAGEDKTADHIRRLAVLAKRLGQDGTQIAEEDERITLWPLNGHRFSLMQKKGDEVCPTELAQEFSRAISGYRLVILDPLRMFHDLSETDGVAMDTLARWLVSVAMTNKQAIVLVHHASQGAMLQGRDDHHVGRGATDLPAACRAAWTLRALTQQECIEARLDDSDRAGWAMLINSKANHSPLTDRVLLSRGEDGLLVRANKLTSKKARPKKPLPAIFAHLTEGEDYVW